MKPLTPPDIDPFQTFTDIVRSKDEPRRGRLKNLESKVQVRYALYLEHRHELSLITPTNLSPTEKSDLRDCYDGPTRALEALKSHIRSSQPIDLRYVCQYCGIGRSDTFDHYLSKTTFPEFAVFSLNLLPCCHICNGHKGNAFLAGGRRVIVHLYFDNLPAEPYLKAEIRFNGDIPFARFLLENPDGNDDVIRRVKTHYTRLKLLRRFGEVAAEALSEARRSVLKHCRPLAPETVRPYLQLEAEKYAEMYSVNHWKSALFAAMAADAEFVAYCCGRDRTVGR